MHTISLWSAQDKTWAVGIYTPDGFAPTAICPSPHVAATLCNYLNGGNGMIYNSSEGRMLPILEVYRGRTDKETIEWR